MIVTQIPWHKMVLSTGSKFAVAGVCFFLILKKVNLSEIPVYLNTIYLPLVALALLPGGILWLFGGRTATKGVSA